MARFTPDPNTAHKKAGATAPSFLSETPEVGEGKKRRPKRLRGKLEPWMVKTAESLIREGMPVATIAGALHITRQTLLRWYQEGIDEACEDELKAEFAAAIHHARSEAAQEGVRMLKLHAMTDYRAAVELLRAQDSEVWSPKERKQVEVNVTHHRGEDLSALTDDQLKQLKEAEEQAEQLRRLASGG